MYKLTFRHSGTSPEGRRCLWMRPRRNYAKHSFVPSTEATCALTCEKNTNKTQHSQNRRMNTKTRICTLWSVYLPRRISILSSLNTDISSCAMRTISKSEYPSVQGRVIVTNCTHDFYITRDSFKWTILVWSRIQFLGISPSQSGGLSFMKDLLVLTEREAHFDVKNAQCWERTRTPRVNWHLFRAIRHEFPSQYIIGDWWKKERDRNQRLFCGILKIRR